MSRVRKDGGNDETGGLAVLSPSCGLGRQASQGGEDQRNLHLVIVELADVRLGMQLMVVDALIDLIKR